MSLGAFYGVGVGPGDPELITVKAAGIISMSSLVFAPKPRASEESLALNIARFHVNENAEVRYMDFPLKGSVPAQERWNAACGPVIEALKGGMDCCFVTLGDPYIYSTYIYLVRAIRIFLPNANIITVPGVTAFNAAAALAQFPLAEADESITLLPASALSEARKMLDPLAGTHVVMKIGSKLGMVRDNFLRLRESQRTTFVSRAGLPGQSLMEWPSESKGDPEEANMTVILTRFKVKGST